MAPISSSMYNVKESGDNFHVHLPQVLDKMVRRNAEIMSL